MPYPASAVANYFLDRAKEEGIGITPMKLQKLLYFAHGWHLGFDKGPLLSERIEAWQYGPVVRSVYSEFARYGNTPIDGRAVDSSIRPASWWLGKPEVVLSPAKLECSDQATMQILDGVWNAYKKFTPIQLSTMTHESGTPWANVTKDGTDSQKRDIPDEQIAEHFKARVQKNVAAR